MAERRYDEREVAEILRKAAESQAAGPEPSGAGLTLGDIQRLAGEVGIDPAHVEAAVASRDSARSTPSRRFYGWGAPSQIVRERTFTGALDDSSWEETVAVLRAKFGRPGTFATLGETREWTVEHDGGLAHASVKSQEGRTRARLMINQGAGVAVSWILTSILGLIFVAIITATMRKSGIPVPTVLSTISAFVAVVYGLVNRALSQWNRRNVAVVEEYMRSIEENIQSLPESDVRTRLAEAPGVETDSTQVST